MPSSPRSPRTNAPDHANAGQFALTMAAFLAGLPLAAAHPASYWVLPLAYVAFQQYVYGVIHEASHRTFYSSDAGTNDLLGNATACLFFGYSLGSFRRAHFEHHTKNRFLIPGEADETEAFAASSTREALLGGLKDLLFLTALHFAVMRLWPKNRPQAAGSVAGLFSLKSLAPLFAAGLFWGALSAAVSPLPALIYWWTLLALYPLSNRIRTYGIHADVTKKNGAIGSEVSCNVFSPFFERIFFGNRMVMYHYDHHLNPALPFREAEKSALKRRADLPADLRIGVPSYFFAVKKLFFSPQPQQ